MAVEHPNYIEYRKKLFRSYGTNVLDGWAEPESLDLDRAILYPEITIVGSDPEHAISVQAAFNNTNGIDELLLISKSPHSDEVVGLAKYRFQNYEYGKVNSSGLIVVKPNSPGAGTGVSIATKFCMRNISRVSRFQIECIHVYDEDANIRDLEKLNDEYGSDNELYLMKLKEREAWLKLFSETGYMGNNLSNGRLERYEIVYQKDSLKGLRSVAIRRSDNIINGRMLLDFTLVETHIGEPSREDFFLALKSASESVRSAL